ncbi:MAG TPA: glycosyltransferase family 39 protein [Gemmatimonadaceae bacterium]|nr:glycosyltransferase family 39 protein [Gemmatimonadaceae bacterium]
MTQSDLPKILRSRKSFARLVAALIAGALAAVLSVVITVPPGLGLDPDAASYLGAAQSLASGRGYRIPISDWLSRDTTSALAHFPPGYPTAITGSILFGGQPVNAARAVNAIAVFVSVALALWLVANVAGLIAGIIAAVSLLAMPAFVELHQSVLSEPMFLACIMGALCAMVSAARQTEERVRLQRALTAGALAATAMLTRYAGAAVIASVCLWMFLLPGTATARLRRALTASLPAIVLVGSWIIHVHLTSSVTGIRTIATYGGFLDAMRMGFDTIVAWMVPLMSDQTLPGREWIALVGVIALCFVIVSAYRTARGSIARVAIAASLTIAACYVIVLLASRLLADPNIPFDNRLLSPLFVLVVVIAAIAIREWWPRNPPFARIACAALVLAWFAASITVSQDEVSWALENGQDFGQEQWRQSPLLAWAQANAARKPLYTNWPAAVFFHLHRASHELPRDSTADVLRAFADTLRARDGVVIVFDQPSPDQIGASALERSSRLRQVTRVTDGSAFGATP